MPSKKIKRVLGIDPGLAHTGFGVIDSVNGALRLVSYGVIETSSEDSHELRLLALYNRLLAVIEEFKPDEACMESLYFSRNASSALAVAEAKGVITLCLAQHGMEPSVYTPNKIKSTVTGTSSADKDTVEQYVQILLNMKVRPEPDHAADALACAITHIHSAI